MMGGQHVVDELPRRIFPAIAKRMRPRGWRSSVKGLRAASFRSQSKDADAGFGEHVHGPEHRKGRDRNTARQRLEQHHAERVGTAREHEHIGGGVGTRRAPRPAIGPVNSTSG